MAMITASMGLHFDFEDFAIGTAWNFHPRLATIGTALLVFGQGDVFVFGRQMIVIASAMPLAAWLLPPCAFLDFDVGVFRIGLGLSRGRGLRFSSIETPFQFANFPLEAMDFFFAKGFALDSALMLSTPIVRLQP